MVIHVHILGETPVRLWGLSSRERLQRVFEHEGITMSVGDPDKVPTQDSVLLLRGDYLYDNRLIKALVETESVILRAAEGREVVAARVPAAFFVQARSLLDRVTTSDNLPGIPVETPTTLCSGFNLKLLKFDVPYAVPITTENRSTLERQLFSGAYKGITDLVTKWVWPVPAQWVTRFCARFGVRPNHVTSLSWVLAILTGLLFAYGFYGWGLTVGWFMSFLDTVDGKLARVTVTYTRFGDLFDHILDLVHPPLWYLAWGVGLMTFDSVIPGLSMKITVWLIFVGYILGRLAEGTFSLSLGKFGIFTWRRVDSYSRLITARRNPCLLLLTVSVLLGRPDLGLVAVAVWTLLSTLFLLGRLATAGYVRLRKGPLQSWLSEVNRATDNSLAARWFVR